MPVRVKREHLEESAKKHGVGLKIADKLVLSLNGQESRIAGLFVDLVEGFCTAGCGPLAPPEDDPTVQDMVEACLYMANTLYRKGAPIAMYAEGHTPGQREGVYEEHCVLGTPESEVIPSLRYLEEEGYATIFRKDCTNGIVGDIGKTPGFIEWINSADISVLVAGGICTDICFGETIQAILSLRTRGLIPPDLRVIVPVNSVATYDFPGVHPRDLCELLSLFYMQQSGAEIVERVDFSN